MLRNSRCDLADLYDLSGDHAEAESVLLGVIEEFPDEAAGYIRLAEGFAERTREYGASADGTE